MGPFAETLLAVALFWLVAAMTPGPNFLLTVREALAETPRHTAATVIGIACGTWSWGLAGYAGVATVFAVLPELYLALKILGGAYLVLLGVRLLRSRHAAADTAATAPEWRGFRRGWLTNMANPKTPAFVVSLFAVTLPPEPPVMLGLAAVAVIGTVSLTWYALAACLLRLAGVRQAFHALGHWVDRVAGAIFIAFGVKLALDR